jgi:hypothetical protein
MTTGIWIIGIDASTDPKKIGVALGQVVNQHIHLKELSGMLYTDKKPSLKHLADWIHRYGPHVLIAVDAPLGWPAALGQALAQHQAGQILPGQSNELFRRKTDCYIKEKTDKQPLDVGADRIARTAHDMLQRLSELRKLAEPAQLPLVWQQGCPKEPSIIEVYPAATLKVLGIQAEGYKGNSEDARLERRSIMRKLDRRGLEEWGEHRATALETDHALDAVICLLAGLHFLQEGCYEPENVEISRQEGWIWVKRVEA